MAWRLLSLPTCFDQRPCPLQVQTIGFFSHLRLNGVQGCTLVVGPLSTLTNWVAEVERWCPSMPALLYHGTKQERAELRRTRMPTGEIGLYHTDQHGAQVDVALISGKAREVGCWTTLLYH